MEDDYKEITKEGLLQRDIIEAILVLSDVEMREKTLATLEARAKELKIYSNWKRLFKLVQAEFIQKKKQKNSYETDFTNSPIKLKCKDYICNDLGVVKSDFNPTLMTSIDTVVCSHPILPVERLVNVDTNTEKVKLAFHKDKKWQTVIAEKNTLASKNKILQLANTGIEVNENNAKDLITFISEVLAINTETIPYNKAITHLGWTEEGFVPYTKGYKFDGDRSFESVFKDVKEKGKYAIWLETVKELRKNNTLHFIIASSFASALIEILHINPFIVHLWGKSGTGKTVALVVAMSIWGNPKVGQLVKNLNSTNVGLERLSAFLNNIPFAGDELQAIKNKYTDFNELIYKLTQGEGKSRGTVDGGIAEQLKWSCAFLTTGEEPITSEFSKEGVKNRVIEIEENKQLISNGKEIVSILIENYGFAGKKFIESITNHIDKLQKRHTEIFNELNNKYNSTGKQTNAIAAIILADEIVSKIIFDDQPLIIDDAEKYFAKDIDEVERINNLIVDWLFENINKFKGYSNGEIWGKYDAIGSENNKEITCFYINAKVLKDFLSSNNVSFAGIKTKLLEKGILEKNSQGRFTFQTTVNGEMQNLIKFNLLKVNRVNFDEIPF